MLAPGQQQRARGADINTCAAVAGPKETGGVQSGGPHYQHGVAGEHLVPGGRAAGLVGSDDGTVELFNALVGISLMADMAADLVKASPPLGTPGYA